MADDLSKTDLKATDILAADTGNFIENKWKLFEIRYDYAWKYFDFHAKQRTTVFNYFVIAAGLFVNGYVTVLKQPSTLTTETLMTILGFAGAGITLAFAFLDRRNEELVHIAEDVLEHLERDVLFPDYRRNIDFPRRRRWSGTMELESKRRSRHLGILLRQFYDDMDPELGPSKFSHGRWYAVVQYLVFAVFIVLALLPWAAKWLEFEPSIGTMSQ